MTQETLTPNKSPGARPEVIIVGAGLGGLTLGILLERAGVPYKILERASTVKPLGSALSLAANLAPMFRQLGIYEKIVAASKAKHAIRQYSDQGVFSDGFDFTPDTAFGGSDTYILPRPLFYDILYEQVPKEKILHNKRVVSIFNGDLGVRVECTDSSVYEGSILVGADGAYSPVRQGMYKQLKRDNKLPPSDNQPLPYDCICLVGQTEALDPEEFPSLKEASCAFDVTNSLETPYKWVTFTTKQNTICWMVLQFLTEESSKEHSTFRNSEWSGEAALVMAKEVKAFPAHIGDGKLATLGDLIDRTPKDLISKVVLEEKVFKTWHALRTVLIGDACHKLNPAAGAGAVSAIQDAVCLANWINVLPSNTITDIDMIFKEYYAERHPMVESLYKYSKFAAASGSKTWKGIFVRYFFTNMPKWLWLLLLKKKIEYRPQISFLPAVEDLGTVPPAAQPSFIKTRAILQEMRAQASAAKNASVVV